jgi:hypothetical protein
MYQNLWHVAKAVHRMKFMDINSYTRKERFEQDKVAHNHKPSTQEAEAGESHIEEQPGLQSQTVLKKKKRKEIEEI